MNQYKMIRRCRLGLAISGFLTGAVWANTTTQDLTDSALNTLTITGQQNGYAETNSLSATRTDTPITEVPQSVLVINRMVMDEQDSRNLSDLLTNISGVRPTRQDEVLFAQPLARGFPAEIYLDGLPTFGGTAASIDPSSLIGAERVEVLKGPTSALYGGGIGAPLGGLINVVSKRPEAATEGTVGIRTGSYSTVNPYADINVPLGDKVAARLSGSYEQNNSWIDHVKSHNWFLQPSVAFELSPQTELIFTGHYNRRSQTEYSGLPATLAINGDIDRHAYPGATNGQPQTTIENQVSTLALKHWFDDETTLNVTGRYFDSKVRDYGSFITNAPDASQPSVYAISALYLPSHVTESTFDTNLATTVDATGGSHELMVGVSYDYTTFNSAVSAAVPIGEMDLAHPDYTLSYGSTPEVMATQTNRYQTLAGYLQDQASWGRFHLLGSLRLTQIELRQAEQDVDTTSHRMTHRIGLTYDLTDNLSAYTAYSTGFRGAFNFVGTEKPKPETSRNYEAGLKLDNKGIGLAGTLALFQQTRRNVATADPNQELALYGYTVQTGEQRARGVELDMTWEPSPAFSLLANYAYTQAEVTEDNSIQPGNGLPRVPHHSGRIAARYRIQNGIARGLGFGAGITAVSTRELTLPNTVSVPGYAMFDAQSSYNFDRYTVTLSAVNLTGVKAYDSYEYLGLPVVIPVQPRSVYLSLSAHF